MNTDRFLTRVFDKLEKKMFYVGDETVFGELLGLNKNGLIFENNYLYENVGEWQTEVITLAFGDRFVPMQCWGDKDKTGKLLFEEDIFLRVDYDKSKHLFICKYKDFMLTAFSIEKKAGVIIPIGSPYSVGVGRSEIIGNRWENEKLLEVKA